MNLRKIIKEEMDDMEWIRRVPSNPLTKDQYVLIWFDREVTKNDLDIMTQWWHEIHGTEDLNRYANHLKRGGYIRFSMDWNDDVYDFGHGTSKTIFLHHVDEPDKYIQYNLSELIPLNVNESEENELDWIKDIPTGVELKPNTMYYFEPIGSPKVLYNLANAITNAPYIKALLGKRTEPLKYFVTGNDVNVLWGWCKGINPFEAKKEFYNNQVDMVDVRKTFGDIL